MAFKAPKRKRCTEDSDSDEDSQQIAIPSETSQWTSHHLLELHISHSNSKISSPDELFDKFEEVSGCIPNLNDDYTKIYDYAQSKFKFDHTWEDLRRMSNIQLGRVLDPLRDLLIDLESEGNDDEGYKKLEKTLKKESRLMINKMRLMGACFISELIDLIVELNWVRNLSSLPETSFSSLLQSFCKICNFNGSTGVPKTKMEICHVTVASVPDLIYKQPSYKNPWRARSRIITVAEVKKWSRQTRSESSSSTQIVTDTENVRGISQHVGQLLLACSDSLFTTHALGIILNQTKVMFTCLALTEDFLDDVPEKLKDDDKGVVYTCGPYDLMTAADRKILLKAFLRLGLAQQELNV